MQDRHWNSLGLQSFARYSLWCGDAMRLCNLISVILWTLGGSGGFARSYDVFGARVICNWKEQLNPEELRVQGGISPEWQVCWPYETEGEGQKLSWVTILLTLWNWGGRAQALLSDNSVDPMKLRGEGHKLSWVTILLTLRNWGGKGSE